MKTSDILNLDYRKIDNKVLIDKALRKINVFENIADKISMEMLEKYIYDCEMEYSMMIEYICPTFIQGVNRYCAVIKNKETQKITDYVYACCVYELYAKICILYCSKIKTSKCRRVDWKELREKMKRRIGN